MKYQYPTKQTLKHIARGDMLGCHYSDILIQKMTIRLAINLDFYQKADFAHYSVAKWMEKKASIRNAVYSNDFKSCGVDLSELANDCLSWINNTQMKNGLKLERRNTGFKVCMK